MVLFFRKFFTLFFLLLALQSFSQKSGVKSFQLTWEMDTELEISNGVKLKFPLIKGNFLGENGLPTYQSIWNISSIGNSVTHSISNVVYENVDAKYLSNISIESIPNEVQSEVSISSLKNSKRLFLSLVPFVKTGNSVKKIVSFNVNYNVTGVAAKNFQSTAIDDSVLASGSWYKFSINETGVFKINKSFLEGLGLSVNDIDPRNIRVYGNGGGMLPELNGDFRYNDLQENAIYVSGEGDGVFNDDDYVLFYGRGAHDWITTDESSVNHRKNIFSEESYYFLTIDKGLGKRITQSTPVVDAATDQIVSFKDYLFKEDDLINIIGTGQQWFGDSFSSQNNRTYNFSFDNIDVTKNILVKIRGASTSTTSSVMNVSVNDQSNVFALNYSAISGFDEARASDNSGSVLVSSSSIAVNIIYNNNGNPSAEAYLDYIEIIGEKLLLASGKQFEFRNFLSQEPSKILEYTIENSNNIDMLWDITNPIEPKQISNESVDANFSFKAHSGVLNTYVVLNNSDYYTPTLLENSAVANQNLHGLKDIQYLVVTRSDFVSDAQRLASYHSTNSDLTTKVVALNQIYNEFGSGSPDITAIRDFVKYLYDNASTEELKIKYLCTFGDSSYDYKDRIPGNNNIVPVKQAYESFNLVSSFVTDDFYGMMDDSEGAMNASDTQDVATGRILVSDADQATIVVDKILKYYNSDSYGNWRNRITLTTDDLDNADEYVFQEDMDEIAESIKVSKPQFNLKKIYADAYVKQESAGGSRYPDVNTAMNNSIDNGTLLFNYFGHGGETGLGSERFMTLEDIGSWVNFDKSPLFITITCDFTRFDNPAKFTAGEEMIVSRIGGSGSLISTTREVYIFYGRAFNKVLIPELLEFETEDITISEALMETKNKVSPSINQRFFIYYLGDPAMKLGSPKPNIKVTAINDKTVDQPRDTLKALSKIRVSGEIQNSSGSLISDYNGQLSAVIYDKPTTRQTLNNDNYSDNGVPLVMTFEVQESSVFRGSAEVTDGKFDFEFIVPKDIKLAYGNSKISLFVKNDDEFRGGYDLETVIGGINENPDADDVGPEIDLYMNDNSFLDGGNTSATPKLIAQFSDSSGINASTGAIGHSITAVIDGDEGNPVVLNEFYEAQSGDFTKGELTYTLRNLEPGSHTLKLKAWDTYNNVSEETLNFIVTESSEFVLENVLNYPNPFVNYTEFWFTHNQPNELLDVRIYVYTVSGKLVKSIQEVVQTTGSLSRTINWDGKDDFGDKVGKGVYVYKLEVTNLTSGIRAEKFEKLVLLQ